MVAVGAELDELEGRIIPVAVAGLLVDVEEELRVNDGIVVTCWGWGDAIIVIDRLILLRSGMWGGT